MCRTSSRQLKPAPTSMPSSRNAPPGDHTLTMAALTAGPAASCITGRRMPSIPLAARSSSAGSRLGNNAV
ncbi:Uncharacterised protein [Mycobacteroides abscessus subsp. abscessus]|nr:Uncharacterised protein [Mycobacteroides abscessus subsp. abscessus]